MRIQLRIAVLVIAAALVLLPQACSEDIYDEAASGKKQIDDAMAAAKKQNKYVLVTWGANWCPWCHRLDEIARTDSTVAKLIRDNYVPVKVDLGHREKNMDLANKFGADPNELGIPHMTVLDGNGKVVGQIRAEELDDPDDDAEDYSPKVVAQKLEKHKPATTASKDGD